MDEQSLTMTSAAMGTPWYVAPEQVLDARSVDIRADVYSLGITFFHLMAGRVPFTGNSAFEVMMQHVNDPLPDLREFNEDVSDATAAVIDRMTQKQAGDRYQTPEDLLRDLNQLIADSPELAGLTMTLMSRKRTGELVCPHCDTRITKKSRFCTACGAPLRMPCPECEEEVDVTQEFCPSCGLSFPDFRKVDEALKRFGSLAEEKRWEEIGREYAGLPALDKLKGERAASILGELRGLDEKARGELAKCAKIRNSIDELIADAKYREALEKADEYQSVNPHDAAMKDVVVNLHQMVAAQELVDCYYDAAELMRKKQYPEMKELLSGLPSIQEKIENPDMVSFDIADESGEEHSRNIAELTEQLDAWAEQIKCLEKEAAGMIRKAEDAAGNHDWDEAKELMDSAEETYPCHPRGRKVQQMIEQARGRYRDMTRLLEQARSLQEQALFDRAGELLEEAREFGRDSSKIEAAEAALRKVANSFPARMKMARDALKKKDLISAEAAARFAHHVCPDSREASDLMGQVVETRQRAAHLSDSIWDSLKAARFEEAENGLQALEEMWSTFPTLDELRKTISTTRDDYAECLKEAKGSLRRRKYVAARDACQRARVMCPDGEAVAELAEKIEAALSGNPPKSGVGSLLGTITAPFSSAFGRGGSRSSKEGKGDKKKESKGRRKKAGKKQAKKRKKEKRGKKRKKGK